MNWTILLTMSLMGLFFLWKNSEPQKQKQIWMEYYSEQYVYYMEPFSPTMHYWESKKAFIRGKEPETIKYTKKQKILAVYDTTLLEKKGWKVYIIEDGRIQKGYMLSKDLNPVRV